MAILEWVFLGTFIGGILFLLLCILSFVLLILNSKKLKEARNKKTKSKSKRKKQKKEIQRFEKSKKKSLISFIICLLLALASGAAAGYVSYYQSVNLSEKDSKSVVEAYYLINDIEAQLKIAREEKDDKGKTSAAIRKFSTQMASFNSRRASELNKEDGQVLLNRYYNIVKEVGINASNQSQDFYGNKELTDEFLNDLKRAKGFQKEVFKYYKVDEKSLQKEI